MRNIKCIIRSDVKTKDNYHLIYIRYTYNRRYTLYSVGEYVKKINWNEKTGRVRKSNTYEKINNLLEKEENNLHSLILDLKIKDIEPTLLNVKKQFYNKSNQPLQVRTDRKKVNERIFLSDFQDFIDDRKDKKQVSEGTIKTYTTTLNKLKEFKIKKNFFLHYNTITEDFYFAFVNFLRHEHKLLDNSLDKHIKNIKLFMNYTFGKRKHSNISFHTFKRTRTKTDFVVLDREELVKLAYSYNPKSGSLKDRVRDTFLLGISTGLRYGDLSELTSGNFIIKRDNLKNKIIDNASDTYLKVTTRKTNQILRIPINYFVFDLIKKYEIETQEITFNNINSQVFNRTIKDVCKEAGITKNVKITKRQGNENVDYEGSKYSFISSHTMRRSFITLMASSASISNIQAVSGHKDLSVLNNYIKRNDKELNNIKANQNDIFYKKDETIIGDKSSGINTRIITT